MLNGLCGKFDRCVNASARLGGIGGELVLMSHLDAMVSMDGANMHMASIVGTPVVSVWGALIRPPDPGLGAALGRRGAGRHAVPAVQHIGKESLPARRQAVHEEHTARGNSGEGGDCAAPRPVREVITSST